MFSKKTAVIFIAITLVAGFTGGFYYREYKIVGPVNKILVNRDSGKPDSVDFSTFWNVWNILHSKYVDQGSLNTQELVYGAIDGMVKAVGDPYTTFFKPAESKSFSDEINGFFGGIGIEIGLRDNVLTVIAPIKDTPAEKAGLLAGDKIIKIGDKSTEGMTTDDAVNLIRGPKGTPIKLTISRAGVTGTKEYSILRDTIKVPTVTWKMMDNNVAYIELSVFNRNVDNDFKKTANEITRSKANKIILDLRNNPGGLLDSAVNIASFFLDTDQIVTTEKFGDGKEDAYRSLKNGQLKNYPLIVLINKGSASASEILAGSLKDNRGVLLVGEKSFGKGVVQEVDDLPAGASFKVTIAKWFTPKGTSINDSGISPDVVVTRTEKDINDNKDPQLDKALELSKNLR